MNTNVDIVMQAIMRGDNRIVARFNNHFGIAYDLPTPQRTGTHTQQRAYARMKAREIVEGVIRGAWTNNIIFEQEAEASHT